MDLSHGIKSRISQAPWVLYSDGASRKPAGHAGFGVVLKNRKGQTVQEVRRFLGGGVSSALAKYKALMAGLKEAKSLQVVGRWTVWDAHLRDQLKMVWVISKEFDSLLMRFIPRDQNLHADRIANAAIDNELQIQEVVQSILIEAALGPPQMSHQLTSCRLPFRHPHEF